MPRQKVILPLYSGGYSSDAPWISSYRCLNLYPEIVPGEEGSTVQMIGTKGLAYNTVKESSTGQVSLIGTPGLEFFMGVGAGPHRGAEEHLGLVYVVSGNQLIEIDSSFGQTIIGTLSTLSGNVSMSSNGVMGGQLTIADGTSLYVFDSNTRILSTISTNVMPNPTKVLFMEGYTVVLADGTNQWQISNFYDSATYSALMYATAEFDPGNLVTAVKINRQLVLMGENVTEIWYDSGNDFPFDHVPNGLIEQGCLAPASAVNVGNNAILWLAKNKLGQGEVYMMQGFQAASITPRSILAQWKTYTHPERAVAFVYQDQGHIFYQITFPYEGKTWVYDAVSGMWHERASYDATGHLNRHLANTHIFVNGIHLVGDYQSGNMYKLSADVYEDNSTPILRELVTYHVTDKREFIRHNYLELEGESGVGLLSGQGTNPVINLEMSDDGGHTYSSAMSVPYGTQGAYNKVARWPYLGKSQNRVYRIRMSDPIKWKLARAILDYTEQTL